MFEDGLRRRGREMGMGIEFETGMRRCGLPRLVLILWMVMATV